MDHAYIEEHQVADRYVLGTLPAAEAERFEDHYLSCPRCLDRLQLAESMQRGFQRMARQDVEKLAAARQLAFVAWLARLGRGRQTAVLAMALLVAALLPWTVAQRQVAVRDQKLAEIHASLERERVRSAAGLRSAAVARAREAAARAAAVPVRPLAGDVATLALAAERGGPSAATPTRRLRLPLPPSGVSVTLAIDPPYQTSYRVVLRDARDQAVWRGDLPLHDDETLSLLLPAPLFQQPGDYTLAVRGLAPGGKPAAEVKFHFRVLRS
jgi:putative zinc finger protein